MADPAVLKSLDSNGQSNNAVFLTEAKRSSQGPRKKINLSPPPSPVEEDIDLDKERHKLDLDDVKRRLYQKECSKLGVIPVGAVMREPSRAKLAIRYYNIGPLGARALAVPLLLDSTMTHLDLEGNRIGYDGLADMYEMFTDNCSLTHLNLKENSLGSTGALLITKLLCGNRFIVSLNVSGNGFQDHDGLYFAEMLKENHTLKYLDLSENHLARQSGEALGVALGQTESLEFIDLSWNEFRERGAAKLIQGIKDNVSLHSVNLSYNACGRGATGAQPDYLYELLSSRTMVQNLDLSNNRLGDVDLFEVARGLKENETLQCLRIGRNPVLRSLLATSALIKAVLANENAALKLLDMTDLSISQASIPEVEELESRGVKVIHGQVHQQETDFDAEPTERPERRVTEDGEAAEEQSRDEDIGPETQQEIDGHNEEVKDRPTGDVELSEEVDEENRPNEAAGRDANGDVEMTSERAGESKNEDNDGEIPSTEADIESEVEANEDTKENQEGLSTHEQLIDENGENHAESPTPELMSESVDEPQNPVDD